MIKRKSIWRVPRCGCTEKNGRESILMKMLKKRKYRDLDIFPERGNTPATSFGAKNRREKRDILLILIPVYT